MDGCHEACETSRFYLLECGEEMVRNMLEMDYLAGLRRIEKMRQRIEGDKLKLEDLPGWVDEFFNLLK